MELEQMGWSCSRSNPPLKKLNLEPVLVSFSSDLSKIVIRNKRPGSVKPKPEGSANFCPKKNKTGTPSATSQPGSVHKHPPFDEEDSNQDYSGDRQPHTHVFETGTLFNFETQTVDPVDYSYNLRISSYSSF